MTFYYSGVSDADDSDYIVLGDKPAAEPTSEDELASSREGIVIFVLLKRESIWMLFFSSKYIIGNDRSNFQHFNIEKGDLFGL